MNFPITADDSTATPFDSQESTLTSIVTIAVQTPNVKVYLLHQPGSAPADAAEVRAGGFAITSDMQFQIGSGGSVNPSEWYAACDANESADVTMIGT